MCVGCWSECGNSVTSRREAIDQRYRAGKIALFQYFSQKIGQNQNRRSSVHKETVSLCTDDRWFASLRIIITDILNGGIGGLVGRNQSLPKSPFSLWILRTSPHQHCEVWSRSIPKILGGSFGEPPYCEKIPPEKTRIQRNPEESWQERKIGSWG